MADAPDDNVTRFFYQEILSRSTSVAPPFSPSSLDLCPALPNVTSLSQSFHLLERKFCTHVHMISLHCKLPQMTLKSVTAESSSSKIEGIDLLSQSIESLSANGAPEYRCEASKIGATRNALVGEE